MRSANLDTDLVVVHASVSLKWVLDDGESVARSIALRDEAHRQQAEMVAPSLWIYEVTNALVVAHRLGRISDGQSRFAQQLLQRVGVRLVDPEPEDCLETAVRLGISAYDAAYVALASATRAVLWTGDRRLFEKTGQKSDLVRWIGDYNPKS